MSDTKNITIDVLIEDILATNANADVDVIRKAYDFAEKAHAGQVRKSGDPFVMHPLETAHILSGMKMDSATIQAALLHDVVEDVENISLSDLSEIFGEEVAGLVDGVTKLGHVSYSTRTEQQSDSMRKMVIAMAKDLRVILIKLADRLHNMRTLDALPAEKRILKSQETLDIFAPLANRFGISAIKWELEDLAFSHLDPERYHQIELMVKESREAREAYGDEIMGQIEEVLDTVHIKARIQGRPKHLYSIYQKMTARGKDFSEIYDLLALRIIVDSVKDVYGVLGMVHNLYKPMPGRFKDYIAMPKFNMYQSLHTTVIGPTGRPLEIQIRTAEMHRRAEYGIAAHWRYKEGKSASDDEKLDDRLSWLRQILDWQNETSDPIEFMDALRIDLFDEEVFVFTPEGDVKSLKKGATPLDFAYSIHTEVGHQTVGAKVNGTIVPLAYHLEMGDQIEILTNKNSSPSRDWLDIVATSSARSKIRSYLSKATRVDDVGRGRDMLMKIMRKHGVSIATRKVEKELDQVARAMHYKTCEDLYAQIGSSKLSARLVGTRLLKQLSESGMLRADSKGAKALAAETAFDKPGGATHPGRAEQAVQFDLDTPMLAPRSARKPKPTGGGVRVAGIDDVLVRLSKCCNPVPGDEIVGFVTRGRGVSVHRESCPNVGDLSDTPERFILVEWDRSAVATYHIEVFIQALDRLRLLQDVTMRIAESGVNILSSSTTTHKDGIVDMRFLFETGEMSNLNALLSSLRGVEGVFVARRMLPGEGSKKK
ncbi:MAG: bifunctional (p)ppGpp synthetase/guanosine-3',5'-bis(diphosphate) 3'-pyrophosphohydrolase [Coriobacteriia bacterium]|nr:bifunctional (p)ppGpp synthetase/guanosine-3',5'-bis(diphosphate) 3'-pyrophosphohydrolase [Coriobacteriia bacterium]